MNDKKKAKLQVSLMVLMILLMVAAFVLIFLGHYGVAFVLFGILIAIMSFISNWTATENDVYIYLKNHKNNDKW